MLGKLPPAEPLPRSRGSHGPRSAPRPSAARLPLPQVTLPGPRLNAPKCTAEFTARGCLDCPSAESSLCARGLSMKSCYFNIITINPHLQLKSAVSDKNFSLLLKKHLPPHTHTHSPNRVLCFVKDNAWKKVFKDTFFAFVTSSLIRNAWTTYSRSNIVT